MVARILIILVILASLLVYIMSGTGGVSGSVIVHKPDLGIGANLNGRIPFPVDSVWNRSIDKMSVDPNSDTLIRGIGMDVSLHPDFGANLDGAPFGIPYVVIAGNTPKVPVAFEYADESDPGPHPIPPGAPIEGDQDGTGDRHILIIDRDHWKLYELFSAYPDGVGWKAGSGAIFDLKSSRLRQAGWTSADAAGLPIFPGLVRYDEVVGMREIRHALRFTVAQSRRAYTHPARHFASSNTSPSLPPMGMRVRLKANYDISSFPPHAQTILRTLKKYGMILADNGSNWFVSGAPDVRWDDEQLNTLKRVKGRDFEVVKMGEIITQ